MVNPWLVSFDKILAVGGISLCDLQSKTFSLLAAVLGSWGLSGFEPLSSLCVMQITE